MWREVGKVAVVVLIAAPTPAFSPDNSQTVQSTPSTHSHQCQGPKELPAPPKDTILNFTITAEGAVTDISVAQSSGSIESDAAAVRCAEHAHYRPAMKDGKPIEIRWQWSIHWRMF